MSRKTIVNLTSDNIFSLIYHHLFEYPLTRLELIKWQPGKKVEKLKVPKINYGYTNGFFYFKNSKVLVSSRILRKRNSLKKIQIAREVSRLLKKIPFVKMVAVTGSLSMFNAKDSSDVDLMVVTRKGRLWTTRLLSILLLILYGIKIRRWGDRNEKNKICINVWIDETSLTWAKNNRNFYTAHEIAQIIPLFDREKTYQMFLNKNFWLKEYWPNSVKIEKIKKYRKYKKLNIVEKNIEKLSFDFQKFYMKKKRTREVVNSKKAFFHPIDRSKDVNLHLMKYFE
ncbi:hypothetical protein KJ570_02420 [Patescibacteria group bacterium]|nr:hypothetical protein [Patescibacteria group bacterium]MBU2036238.1 hypothetical protein [Patescibacteria group bacterium]